MRPSWMWIARLACCATPASCVTSTTVRPSSVLSRFNMRRISSLVRESRLPVGSSASRIDGADEIEEFLGALASFAIGDGVGGIGQRHDDIVEGAGAGKEIEALEDEADVAEAREGALVGREVGDLLAVELKTAGGWVIEA